MKPRLPVVLLFILSSATATALGNAPVAKTVEELRQAIADRSYHTRFDLVATLTQLLSTAPGGTIAVQDGELGVWFFNHVTNGSSYAVGDRVRAKGAVYLGDSGRISTDCHSLEVLARPGPPPVHDISAAQLPEAADSKRLVRLKGTLVETFQDDIDSKWMYLVLNCDGATVYASVRMANVRQALERMIGFRLALTGVCNVGCDTRQTIGALLNLQSDANIEILQERTDDPFDAEDVRDYAFGHRDTANGRRSAVGTVIAVWDRNRILVRTDEMRLIRGDLVGPPPACGERIRLVGFPETDLYNPILVRAIWRTETTGPACPAERPVAATVRRIHSENQSGQLYDYSYHGKTIRMDGIVRALPIDNGDGIAYLENDNQLVKVDVCALRALPPEIKTGYGVEITGVCIMETEHISPNRTIPHISGFRIVPRSAADIRITSRPPWWTPARLLSILSIILALFIAILIRNRVLRRMIERRSRQLAKAEIGKAEANLRVKERTRLAVELHDTLSQNLLGASMEINTAEQLVSGPDALRHLGIASKTLRASRDELRNCLWDLRSQALEEPDMNAAIRRTLEPHVGGIDLQVRFNVPRETFTDNTAHALMRIIRELVLNAIRHGHAKTVKIAGSREDGQLLFSVRDDGCGFDPASVPGIGQGHFGLQGVRERLRLLKGTVRIESAPGAGTYVSARLHLPDDETERI